MTHEIGSSFMPSFQLPAIHFLGDDFAPGSSREIQLIQALRSHNALQRLFPYFYPPLPMGFISRDEASLAVEVLIERTQYILDHLPEGIEETSQFNRLLAVDLLQNPDCLEQLLQTAYECSLVLPFVGFDPQEISNLPASRCGTLHDRANRVRMWAKERAQNMTGGLNFTNCGMLCLPEEFCQFSCLTSLKLKNNYIQTLPPQIANLTELYELNARENAISELPPEIAALGRLKILNLRDNRIAELPPEIINLIYLKKLDLGNNRLRDIRHEICNLRYLKQLYLDRNRLSLVPHTFMNLINLKELYLGENGLSELPGDVVTFLNLRVLSLPDNRLYSIPPQILYLRKLQVLDISNNPLEQFLYRELIRHLPELRELYIGNPEPSCMPMPPPDWSEDLLCLSVYCP